MAYTQHPTVNAGDYWTAANQNTYVKDNFDFIANNQAIILNASNRGEISNIGVSYGVPTTNAINFNGNLTTSDGSISNVLANNSLIFEQNDIAGWSIILPPMAKKLLTANIYLATTSSTSPGNIDLYLFMSKWADFQYNYVYHSSTISNGDANVVYEHSVDISEYNIGYESTGALFSLALYRSNTTDDVYGAQNVYVYGINLVYSFTT